MLSRIDGMVSESELAALSGLEPGAVGAALSRLVELGAIELAHEGPSMRPVAEPNAIASAAYAALRAPAVEVVEPRRGREPAASVALYDPSELDEPCDLDIQRKRKILDLYHRLDELDHYGLLGVEPSAEKAAIKRAYYALASEFHPDRFFRKSLGAFKPKMEAIFGRLTLAHDTLTDREKRADYDAYLGTTQRNRTMEEALTKATAPIARATAAPRGSVAPPVAPAAPVTPSSSAPPVRRASIPPPPSIPPAEAERARREALARKLVGRTIPPPAPPPQTARPSRSPATPPSAASEAAMQELIRRRDALQATALRAQLDHYVEAARAAQNRNDPATAANFYRLARALDPDDLELAALQESTATAAAAALADGYLRQGDYEARHGRWKDAALSYGKAATGLLDDVAAQLKAATAIIRAGGDLRRAVEFGRRAVALAPKRLEPHLVLAHAYIGAGLMVAANKELDAAREIAPKDAKIADLAKRAR